MNAQQKAIAQAINETYSDIILLDDKDNETRKILSFKLADLFEREEYDKFIKKEDYTVFKFDRKEFLKSCGAQE